MNPEDLVFKLVEELPLIPKAASVDLLKVTARICSARGSMEGKKLRNLRRYVCQLSHSLPSFPSVAM